ncbi:MAG TPA: hypothetical protein VL354_19115, partial [Spirochaetia bacterium]|nr:hypothetical protein [Spirochaetia bacterium]
RSRNIFRTHMGSQWNGERYGLVARRFADMAGLAAATGMQGLTIFGEVSAFEVANEINYLAFARFGYTLGLTWDAFVRDDLAPLLGGADEARKFLELCEIPPERSALDKGLGEAREIARTLAGEPYRRWVWLQNRICRKQLMGETR